MVSVDDGALHEKYQSTKAVPTKAHKLVAEGERGGLGQCSQCFQALLLGIVARIKSRPLAKSRRAAGLLRSQGSSLVDQKGH